MVQSPDEAAEPGMPRNAIAFGCPIHLIAPIDDLAKEICRLTDPRPPGNTHGKGETDNRAGPQSTIG